MRQLGGVKEPRLFIWLLSGDLTLWPNCPVSGAERGTRETNDQTWSLFQEMNTRPPVGSMLVLLSQVLIL